jgi:hypothetical protein
MKKHPEYVAARQSYIDALETVPRWYKEFLAFIFVASLGMAFMFGAGFMLLVQWLAR